MYPKISTVDLFKGTGYSFNEHTNTIKNQIERHYNLPLYVNVCENKKLKK